MTESIIILSTEDKVKDLSAIVDSVTDLIAKLALKIDDMEKNPSTTMMHNMERMIQKLTDKNAYHEPLNYDTTLSTRLPEKFSVNDLPKFKPIDDPRFHLKNFRSIMLLKGVDLSLFPTLFPLSLEPVCQKWYYSLPSKDTTT